MIDRHNDDWSWFGKLLTPLRARSHESVHPSRSILHAYVKGQLPDMWRVRVRALNLGDWTLTEVSQHVLTCGGCAQQLALLRRRELERVTPWRDFWHSLPGAVRTHLAVYISVLLALFIFNAFLVMVLPAPTVSLPCVPFVGVAGPYEPDDSQAETRNLKREGLNHRVRLPDSLSGVCRPVPAPRPLWQTWWIGWVFLLWTALLGLHMLWDWPVSSPLQRPATASVAIWSIGFISVFV